MKKIRYIDYFLDRLSFRKIPKAVVERILHEATERYVDADKMETQMKHEG